MPVLRSREARSRATTELIAHVLPVHFHLPPRASRGCHKWRMLPPRARTVDGLWSTWIRGLGSGLR